MKKVIFIVNPQARNGKCKQVWKQLEERMRLTTIDYEVMFTKYARHATELTRMIVSRRDSIPKVIVAVGGDGTIQEIVSGFTMPLPAHIDLSYIPCGSANDFSLGFRLAKDPFEALDELIKKLNEPNRLIDLGEVKGEGFQNNFINNMGLGYDAQICESVNASSMKTFLNKIGLGKFVYVYFLIKHLITYKPTTFTLLIDGKQHVFEDGWFCSISNQPYYGGGMKISPWAQTDDGILNITMVNKINRFKLLTVFITVFWGGHTKFKEVHFFEGKDIQIQTGSKLPIHADGEIIGKGDVQISVHSRSVHFIP